MPSHLDQNVLEGLLPRVYLVGAGPGNPELLTLRAITCLSRADLVIYDRLVPPGILEFARSDARLVCVTELASRHAERCLPIHRTMIDAARAGQCVVRLKGGDPLIFGRAGEEAEALHEAGIPYEIVPGVTAASGAAAYAGIPLTQRALASAVAFVTGHEDPAKRESALDWPALAHFPGTLVFYMGLGRLEQITTQLLKNGRKPDTPVAVVQRATTASQQTVCGCLQDIAERVAAAGLEAPTVFFVGEVVALRGHLSWFEERPLFGQRILVTRPRLQAGNLARRLEELGASTVCLPAIDIRPLGDWTKVDQALARLGRYHWLVFTSANGVRAFFGRLEEFKRDSRALGSAKLAAIGPGTADAIRSYYLEPDLVPDEFRSERLAQALGQLTAGRRVLLVRANRGRDLLRRELGMVAEVDEIAVYEQVDNGQNAAETLCLIKEHRVDYVTVTSSNIALALIGALDSAGRDKILAGDVKLASISPVTSAAIKDLGMPVAAEALTYDMAGLVTAIVRSVRAGSAQVP